MWSLAERLPIARRGDGDEPVPVGAAADHVAVGDQGRRSILRRLCVDIREHYFPVSDMPPPTSPEFGSWVEGRARLDGLTQVNVTMTQQLTASLFILAPLLSGVLGALVPSLP